VSVLACLVSLACGNATGGHCTSSAECQSGLVCLPTSVGANDGGAVDREPHLCMRLCDHDAGDGIEQHLCSDGASCLAIEGMRVCYLGGTHAIHAACVNDSQCEPGTLCAPDTLVCTQACTVGNDAPCADNEVCNALGGGLCRAPAVVVDDAGM
jgi:hypothetical protein